MDIEASEYSFGIEEADSPFAYVLFIDEKADFIFSLTRMLGKEDDLQIEFMVLDQILVRAQDVNLKIRAKCIETSVPTDLRKYTNNDNILRISYEVSESQAQELIKCLKLFLQVRVVYSYVSNLK